MTRSQFAIRCMATTIAFSLVGTVSLPITLAGTGAPGPKTHVNSIGMRMLAIPAGTFRMGNPHANLDEWDEQPTHHVTISRPFLISETEVTIEQFQRFRPGVRGSLREEPFITGISWHDAVAFCVWLSHKEGKPYRLPTEAEWEYCARAGSNTPFWSGGKPPRPGAANPWGLKYIHSAAREWVHDWYGPYSAGGQVDPVGAATGRSRVVRGGGLDRAEVVYRRSANRASFAPAFAMMEGTAAKAPAADADAHGDTGQSTSAGLIGAWFAQTDFKAPQALDHMPTLNVDWNDFQQPGENREDRWSARWEGSLIAPATGKVTFHIAADNRTRLVINGKTVMNSTGRQTPQAGSIRLRRGAEYPIQIWYVHNGGERSFINVSWSWSRHRESPIPKANLRHTAAQIRKWRKRIPREVLPGHHPIGFRVVQAPMPTSAPRETPKPFHQLAVIQNQPDVARGPDPARPWFRQRPVMPIPPDYTSRSATVAAGLHPALKGYLHCPGLVAYPNGDVMVVYFSARPGPHGENDPNVLLVASRLRFGAEQWDMPEPLVDFADVNDTSSFLCRAGHTVYLFWGHTHNDAHYPFLWMASNDLGATWGPVHFPHCVGEIGPYTPQPINSAIRYPDGTFLLPSDGKGSSSLLWATEDHMRTWFDTGGRTLGRHTSFALLHNGSILGMGGKKAAIDQFMPKSISRDRGKSWQVSKTPFPPLGGGQRPTLLRLQSGRLFFAGDYRHSQTGKQPPGYTEDGAYVALSADEGATWHIKPLAGTLPSMQSYFPDRPAQKTIGYAVACQAPNGIIHLVGSRTQPNQHWELNEAWILADRGAIKPSQNPILHAVQVNETHDPSGRLQARFGGGITPTGEYRLDGPQVHYFENGKKQWQAVYRRGRKIGQETLWDRPGRKRWTWVHRQDGTATWTQYWPDGNRKSQSNWHGFRADGRARRWNAAGKLISDVQFTNGVLRGQPGVVQKQTHPTR